MSDFFFLLVHLTEPRLLASKDITECFEVAFIRCPSLTLLGRLRFLLPLHGAFIHTSRLKESRLPRTVQFARNLRTERLFIEGNSLLHCQL